MLSILNWLLEIGRWRYALKLFGIKKDFKSSGFQVLYAQPFALIFGKLAGNSFGRLIHFKAAELMNAIKAQVVSGIFQSGALLLTTAVFMLLHYQLQYAWSFIFGIIIVIGIAFMVASNSMRLIGAFSVMRLISILLSYKICLAGFDTVPLFSALTKTFSILTFLPFSPLATLGSKEWLMHHFFSDLPLERIISAGLLVFIFNNLLPAIVGSGLTIFHKWKLR